jgi:SAM-dependent methyltransferase
MRLTYLLAGVIRRHAPPALLFAIMKRRGTGNRSEEAPDVAFGQWRAQLERSGLSLAGAHVVEIGSGRYARTALRLLRAGARRVSLIDLYALPLDHPEQRAMLQADCRSLGLGWEEVRSQITVIGGDLLELGPDALVEPAELVVSSAVLEHVRDPRAVLARCHTWLRPGGATFHMVDLRDHNFHFRYPFEMLAYSDDVWRRWLDIAGGFHVNRWRAHDHLQALADAGFEQITYEPFMVDHAALAAMHHRLDRRFRRLPEQLLAIQMIYLYGRKPGRGD